MTFEEARQYLSGLHRYELQDHAFGDREVSWTKEPPPCTGYPEAEGYAGGSGKEVCIYAPRTPEQLESGDYGLLGTWTGAEALALIQCGLTATISRNDTTGPEEYQDGVCMPALTLEGVRQEVASRK